MNDSPASRSGASRGPLPFGFEPLEGSNTPFDTPPSAQFWSDTRRVVGNTIVLQTRRCSDRLQPTQMRAPWYDVKVNSHTFMPTSGCTNVLNARELAK